MERTRPSLLMGKILSAAFAIVMAGCLIFQEQAKKTPVLQNSTAQDSVPTQQEPQSIVQSMQIDVADSYGAPHSVDISNVAGRELEQLLVDISISRTDPTFFATSKSGPPPAASRTYTMRLKKGETSQKETVNLSKIEEKAWQDIYTKIRIFHVQKMVSSVVLVNTTGKEVDLLKSTQEDIQNLVLEIEKTMQAQEMVSSTL